ncbi:hypothetical protein [uncultured Phycicoccus sp.]|uniref:hypothetical protein n=1 Tax=uncultured Phycicoccus sp. TaxID=661422 RepID=UPI002636BA23|nr:hypothetical protein [uncultured Phycicoccus sp.]
MDDLPGLAAFNPEELADVLGNHQKASGVLKAQTVVQAAENLVRAGVTRAADLHDDEHRRAYPSVYGLGDVTWENFTMLLGHPGVKADNGARGDVVTLATRTSLGSPSRAFR